MDAFRLLVTVLVMVGVVVAILMFERRRAERIERDTQQMGRDRQEGEIDGKDEAPSAPAGRTDGVALRSSRP